MHSITANQLSPAVRVRVQIFLLLPNEWLWSSQVLSQKQRQISEQMFRNIILENNMVLRLWHGVSDAWF